MRRLLSYGLALIIILGLGLWLSTGTLVVPGRGPGNGEMPVLEAIEGEEGGAVTQAFQDAGVLKPEVHHEGPDPALSIAERQAATATTDSNLQSVRIASYSMQPMPIEVPVRGRTKAKTVVSVVPETAGTVEQVHVQKGQAVAQGDLLCTLDRGTRQGAVDQANAAVQQAQAALEQARQQFETNRELREKGLAAANTASQFESALRAAEAQVAAATSGLENATAELGRVDVHAPVEGIIQDPLSTVGAMLAQGQPCVTIVQLDPILFVGAVPEARIAYAKLGLPAEVTTITGQTVKGEVTYIASVADPATRSFGVEIELPNPNGAVRDGITATAVVDVGTAPGHLLPQSVLTLDDEGVLGVRTVENDVVAFYPVTILKDAREGVWVSGLPPKAEVITVGQEYVKAGQKVAASYGQEPDPEKDVVEAASAETSH